MKTTLRGAMIGLTLVLAVLCLTRGHATQGGKETGWKEFLPAGPQKELLNRAKKDLTDALAAAPAEEAVARAQFVALTIAGYARSGAPGGVKNAAAIQSKAIQVAMLLGQKGQLANAKKAAKLLETWIDGAQPGAKPKDDFTFAKSAVPNAAVMEHYKTLAKGGEGLPSVLQSNIKLKGKQGNGLEEKIRALAMKKLLQGVLAKESNELALLAYRAAVVAEIVYELAPAKKIGKKDPAEWRTYAISMRNAGIDLALAAQKKDADGVFQASNKLNSSCSQCHSTFRLGN